MPSRISFSIRMGISGSTAKSLSITFLFLLKISFERTYRIFFWQKLDKRWQKRKRSSWAGNGILLCECNVLEAHLNTSSKIRDGIVIVPSDLGIR